MLSEMLYEPDKHRSVCPDGYELFYNNNTTVKYSAILCKISEHYTVEQRKDYLNCTSVAVKFTNGETMGLTSFYRSPSHKSPMYSELKLGGGEGSNQTKYVEKLNKDFPITRKSPNSTRLHQLACHWNYAAMNKLWGLQMFCGGKLPREKSTKKPD